MNEDVLINSSNRCPLMTRSSVNEGRLATSSVVIPFNARFVLMNSLSTINVDVGLFLKAGNLSCRRTSKQRATKTKRRWEIREMECYHTPM